MQKNIILFMSLLITNIFTLHAMELEVEQTKLFKESSSINHYGLTDSLLGNIQDQSNVHEVVQKQPHPESLCKIYATLSAMSDNAKRTVLNKMSEQALLLTYIATCFPQEITKYICFFMFDGNEKEPEKYDAQQATEQFYSEYSVIEALGLYNDIRARLSDLTKPIGPLFVMACPHRNIILGIHTSKHAHSRMPRISKEAKELLDKEISDDVRQIFLKGEKIVVLSDEGILLDDSSFRKRTIKNIACGVGAGLLTEGVLTTLFATVGACCLGSPGLACGPVLQAISLTSSGLACFVFSSVHIMTSYDSCFTRSTTL